MTMRSKGEGSVTKEKNGKWKARVRVNGKAKTKTCNTQREAVDALADLRKAFDDEKRTAADIDVNAMTIDMLASEFINSKKTSKTHSYSPSTIMRLESTLRNHIVPELSYIYVNQIATRDLQKLIDIKYREGLSYSSIKKIQDAISAIFAFAVQKQYILPEHNPTLRLEKYTSKVFNENHEIIVLNDEEIQRVYDTAKTSRGKYAPCFVLLLNTGMRAGELCALKKSDIDFDAKTIHVHATAVTDAAQGYKTIIKDAKTARSDRFIPLSEASISVLSDFYDKSEELYLLTTSRAEIVPPYRLDKAWAAFCIEAGIPHKGGVHILRHTYATVLINRGVPLHIVSALLGHANTSVTEKHYARILESAKAEALAGIGNI